MICLLQVDLCVHSKMSPKWFLTSKLWSQNGFSSVLIGLKNSRWIFFFKLIQSCIDSNIKRKHFPYLLLLVSKFMYQLNNNNNDDDDDILLQIHLCLFYVFTLYKLNHTENTLKICKIYFEIFSQKWLANFANDYKERTSSLTQC